MDWTNLRRRVFHFDRGIGNVLRLAVGVDQRICWSREISSSAYFPLAVHLRQRHRAGLTITSPDATASRSFLRLEDGGVLLQRNVHRVRQ